MFHLFQQISDCGQTAFSSFGTSTETLQIRNNCPVSREDIEQFLTILSMAFSTIVGRTLRGSLGKDSHRRHRGTCHYN